MILVVADTSRLNYLILIHREELLPALYKRVFVPTAVIRELAHTQAPTIVRAWLSNTPEWLEIREVRSPSKASLAGLGPGEREAIQLAQEEHADLLLIDERLGATLAKRQDWK